MRRLVPAIFAVILCACGHASIVSEDPNGGVMTLHADEGAAMADARSKMAKHCGNRGYYLIRRARAKIGDATPMPPLSNPAAPAPAAPGATSAPKGTPATSAPPPTEVRVAYACGHATQATGEGIPPEATPGSSAATPVPASAPADTQQTAPQTTAPSPESIKPAAPTTPP